MTPFEWLLATLVSFRLTRLVSEDFPPVKAARDWVLRRWPGPDSEFPMGEVDVVRGDLGDEYRHVDTGVPLIEVDLKFYAEDPHWLGQLIECYWCHGYWISLGVLAVFFDPTWWELAVGGFALSGLVGLIRSRELSW